MGNLRSGKTQSCGCTSSKQEEKIIKMLVSSNILFSYQKIIPELSNKKFDFWIEGENIKPYVIEYDGS